MLYKRFTMKTLNKEDGTPYTEVTDHLYDIVVGTYTHEWRAERDIKMLMHKAHENQEPMVLDACIKAKWCAKHPKHNYNF